METFSTLQHPNVACMKVLRRGIYCKAISVCVAAEDTTNGARGLGSIPGPVTSAKSPTLANIAMFFLSCVTQALSRGDGPRHLLYASVSSFRLRLQMLEIVVFFYCKFDGFRIDVSISRS